MGPLLISLPESMHLCRGVLFRAPAGFDVQALGPHAESLALLLLGAALVLGSFLLRRLKTSPSRGMLTRVPVAKSGEAASSQITAARETVAR
jgi:hypothetical protein